MYSKYWNWENKNEIALSPEIRDYEDYGRQERSKGRQKVGRVPERGAYSLPRTQGPALGDAVMSNRKAEGTGASCPQGRGIVF